MDTASKVERDSDGGSGDKSGASTDLDTGSEYSSELASNKGYGTDDTLAVTRALEKNAIPCCLVGIAALVFYGADRLRDVGTSISLYICICMGSLT